MGLYSTTRTITASKTELDNMCYAQDDFVSLLDNKTTDTKIIANTFVAYGAAIIPLLFAVPAVAAVGLGVASLIATLNAVELQEAITNSKEGHRQLLKAYRMLVNWNATKVNMTLNVNKERPNNEFAFVNSLSVNWYQLADGTKIMG